MNKKYPVLVMLLCACIARMFSQEPAKDGYTKIYYPNGKLSSEGMMRDGLPDGYWKTYFPTGVIKSEGTRRNHLLDSTWVFYNELGDTLRKVNYVMGKRNGFVTEYRYQELKDPSNRGKMVSRELYVNDKKAGKSYYYHENGAIQEIVEYRENKRNGTAMEYDIKGNIITIEQYVNGTLVERERINRPDQKGLKQGVWKTFYDNGRIRSEANYKDDRLNGPYKEYDENGVVKVFFQYVNGNMQERTDTSDLDIEVRNQYNEKGNVIFSGSFRKDIPVGIHRNYDNEGKVTNAILYSDRGEKIGEGIITDEGKKEGNWKYFYGKGNVRASGNYSNNFENGPWKYFYPDGKTEQNGTFKNGKFNGTWQWYFENGNLKREEDYFEGREEGNCIEYDSVGEVIVKGSYFDGLKEGEWYYHAGDYSESGKYTGDLKDGTWKGYYSNGKLAYEGNYIQGNPDGEHKYYYPSGQLKEIDFYVMGIAEKNWKKFDEAGNLLITITYRDNKEYRINGEKIEFYEDEVKLIQ